MRLFTCESSLRTLPVFGSSISEEISTEDDDVRKIFLFLSLELEEKWTFTEGLVSKFDDVFGKTAGLTLSSVMP